ncbi:hypothetical protein PGH07_01270 [Sulfurovum sp. zt1-1]|uniref:Uncharacterized protein n=1 Tax=Sulfurovum zhangzhouensis TaxID=3019067 RepID=A0ABT7QVI0_9BACT|nr:hypothetical protein [Sulfurovum zhangzhouensis]MDM5270802.1 hypothetical protein [Sulfurovum zhangzhouensis]
MTIDVNVEYTTEDFLDEIDEIIEDTMIQMFFLQPKNENELEKAKEDAEEYSALFYAIPLSFKDEIDANCIGYRIESASQLQDLPQLDKPLFIDESIIDDETVALLKERKEQGIILNATHAYESLENFFVALGAENIDSFDEEVLASLSMDKIVLQSGFPKHDFDDIYTSVKKFSNALFRPEESIVARATKHTLQLTGFKK